MAANEEGRLDRAVVGVLSGAAPATTPRKQWRGGAGLIRRDDGLALLFAPPFDKPLGSGLC